MIHQGVWPCYPFYTDLTTSYHPTLLSTLPSKSSLIENKHSVAPAKKFLPHILTETWLFVIELFHLWLLLVLPHLKHFKFRDENSILVSTKPPKKQTLVFDPLGLCLNSLLFPIAFITPIFINIRHSSVGTMFYCFLRNVSWNWIYSFPSLLSSAFKFDVLLTRLAMQDAVLHD